MAIEQGNDTAPDDNKMHVTSVLAQQHEHAILDQDATSDEQTLGALGYKQEFKRCDHGYELVPLPQYSAIPQPQNIQPHFPLYSDVPSVCIPLDEHTLADFFRKRFLTIRVIFSVILRARSPSINRVDSWLFPWLQRHGRRRLGLAHRESLHSVHCLQHGRAVLQHADRRRSLLRCGCACTRGLGSAGELVRWLVELLRIRNWAMQCELRAW